MIGRTRQSQRGAARAARGEFVNGCGVLPHGPVPGAFRHVRMAAPALLTPWVEHFWFESWEFTDAPAQRRELLPQPSVHLVFTPRGARIYGVQHGKFVRQLRGAGRLFGARFHPGAFYPFLRADVATLANHHVAASTVFTGTRAAAQALRGCRAEGDMVASVTRFLARQLPAPDAAARHAQEAVAAIIADRSVMRVPQLAQRLGLSERSLQRLFRRYVGASARWVIKRYRMYEALEQLCTGQAGELARLAQDLGYFDQAHFTNDFRRLIGQAPAAYLQPRRA